ncbi:MAG: hypothetical protein ACKVS5_16790 [Parvularculaceae bacterium]
MPLITRYALQGCTLDELKGHLCAAFRALAQSAPESAERRDALASLETIEAELRSRPTLG